MVINDVLLKHGFVKEEIDLYLNKMALLNNSIQLKEIHIDIYPEIGRAVVFP